MGMEFESHKHNTEEIEKARQEAAKKAAKEASKNKGANGK